MPAPSGCNLNCGFCLVRQRQEISETRLTPLDLARFVHQAARRAPIYALALQGYEPLLPASREYSQAILSAGQLRGIPTTLVTNGVHLAESISWLAHLSPNTIAVSLDSALAATHDRIRGVEGAWTATTRGIQCAVEMLMPRTRIAVASVLTSRREPLDGMPALLRDLGISHWIITPLQRVGRNEPGGPAGSRAKLYDNLLALQDAADEAGITLTVDDELDHLNHKAAVAAAPHLSKLNVRKLPTGVDLFRLVPSGHVSLNDEILTQVRPSAPQWVPERDDAGEFLANLKSSRVQQHPTAA